MHTFTLLLAVCALLGADTAAATLEPYTCIRAKAAPTIDADLSDPVWAEAGVLPIQHVLGGDTTSGIPEAVVRLAYDDTHLYVAYTFEDKDIWAYSDEDDDMLWLGDVAELFVKPSEEETMYYEFNVSPTGALMDAQFPNRGAGGYYRGKAWSSRAVVATRVDGTEGEFSDDDTGWTVEMAVPLSAFGVAEGETPVRWTFGAFRYDYGKQYDTPLQLMSIPKSRAGFHAYEDYRPLVFEQAR
jgi:hypothetical protein